MKTGNGTSPTPRPHPCKQVVWYGACQQSGAVVLGMEGAFARRLPSAPSMQMNVPGIYHNALPPNITPSSSSGTLSTSTLYDCWGSIKFPFLRTTYNPQPAKWRRNPNPDRFFGKTGSQCPGSQSQAPNAPSFWLLNSWSHVEPKISLNFRKKIFVSRFLCGP